MEQRTPAGLLSRMESLSDATRLRLLRLLESHELGVAELVQILQLPQSTVSRHLKVLSDGGLVRSRAQGTSRFYGMVPVSGDSVLRRLWDIARAEAGQWPTAAQDNLRLAACLRERQPRSQGFFATAAERWDHLRDEMYGRAFAEPALLALVPRQWTLADLGCGTGLVAAALAPHVLRVIGVDQSQAMLEAAARRTQGMPNVELRKGNLESLPLADDACNGALLLLVLTYVSDPVPVIAEMARILKPGGRAVVLDLLRHDRADFQVEMGQEHPGFEGPSLTRLLVAAGLEGPRFTALPPSPEAKGPALILVTAEKPSFQRPPKTPLKRERTHQ
jgi:SAM-dependent methyltransferase